MPIKKIKLDCFSDEIYQNEFISFYPLYNTTHCKYVSADTETKLYYNGKLLTEDDAYILYRDNGQAWVKENITVNCYAFTLSTGKGFALFQNVDDFLIACAMLNVERVIWYNAKFDFSIFDYYFLTNGWKNASLEVKEQRGKGLGKRRLNTNTYTSLNGEYGQRYQMQIWKSYLNRNSQNSVHKFKMIDLCNISGGGLAKNLESWNINDEDGNPIRKLEMDYTQADIMNADDMQYMINDVKGLFYLFEKINDTMQNITGFSLLKGDYITAGGLAIKTLLKEMYGKTEHRYNKKLFRIQFPMSVKYDRYLRDNHLYLGGKCLVNPYKTGVLQKNIYKYDVNSMYPTQMRNMLYPYGRSYVVKEIRDNKRIKVIKISYIYGLIKKDKIPIFQDFETKNYEDCILINTPFLIWYEELQELEKWYVLKYKIDEVYEYDGFECDGAIKFVDKFYNIKCNSKGAVKSGAKLILNSSYGKLAQRIEITKGEYELSDKGYAHYVVSNTEIDEKSMLSVLVGSRITALARVSLMKYIREICNENVKDNFIYCDTDSVHALTEYKNTDENKLGYMKNEGVFKYALYIAPKSYFLMDENGEYEAHTKGINTKVVKQALKGLPIEQAIKVFTANKTFKSLSGINCKGGKALIYIDKMILNDKEYYCDSTILGEDGILYEDGA